MKGHASGVALKMTPWSAQNTLHIIKINVLKIIRPSNLILARSNAFGSIYAEEEVDGG